MKKHTHAPRTLKLTGYLTALYTLIALLAAVLGWQQRGGQPGEMVAALLLWCTAAFYGMLGLGTLGLLRNAEKYSRATLRAYLIAYTFLGIGLPALVATYVYTRSCIG